VNDQTEVNAEIPAKDRRGGVYGWYVIFVLTLCQVLAFIDAKLPYILVEALKADLDLSDTQIGLITGPAFSLTYAICAIPIAKIADRHIRTRIISIAIIIWSGLTAAGGAAAGFASFAVSRIGVAAGEAGFAPAAHSIIADYTTPASRPKAMAMLGLGSAVGATLALVVGGVISDQYGWRMALYLVGASGVTLALLMALTVREPTRTTDDTGGKELPKGNLKSLLANGGLRNMIIAGALMGMGLGVLQGWGPAYIMRSFDMTATQTGTSFGIVTGITSTAGLLTGGFVGSRLNRRSPGSVFKVLAVAFVIASACQLASLMVDNYYIFLGLTAGSTFLLASYFAPTFAGIQSLTDPSARAFAAAVTIFAVNGIGGASGAFLAGFLSDVLNPSLGENSLRWALAMLTFTIPWAALHYYFAAREMDRMAAD